MTFSRIRLFHISLVSFLFLATSCTPVTAPSAEVQAPDLANINQEISPGFTAVDGSRPLIFPQDFGAHPDFRTEWWYYTGNLETPEGRHFGFELTVFRVGLLPPTTVLPTDSDWYSGSIYFAHFAISDIAREHFYAFERYSRPGPGLSGAQGDPFRVWLEDWNVTERTPGVYQLQAEQGGTALDLTLADDMGIVLHGAGGYTRGGENASNAAYYYSQPRLRADGSVKVGGEQYPVTGLAWHDHEFSSGFLDKNQVGWDWLSLQFDEGPALMLYQMRERDTKTSPASSGTYISTDGTPRLIRNTEFSFSVLDTWRSPHTGGVYPAGWDIRIDKPACRLQIHPWMADQEVNFPAVTYWEGAVRFEGTCDGAPVYGNGYFELTGYAGNLPLP